MAVQVLTDSTSYIDKGIRRKLGIRVVSLSVIFENEGFKEIDIQNQDFYKKLDQKKIPSSSQPSVDEMYHEMKEVIEQGDDLICIFISSKMSGTYSSAHIAKDMVLESYPNAKIEIIDSTSNSMQLGFAAVVAARYAKEGNSLEKVKEIVEENIKRSRFIFLPENLEFLRKGGRIGGAGALIGNLLKIIPILTVENGVTTVVAKVRTKKKAIEVMLDQMFQDARKYGIKEICVHHINCLHEAQQLASYIKEKINMMATICDIGPVIGLHVGPGAIGIVYYTEKNMR